MNKNKEKIGDFTELPSLSLYTLGDVKSLYHEMVSEHYGDTLNWLRRIYPLLVTGQLIIAISWLYLYGLEWTGEGYVDMTHFLQMSLCALVSVSWPMLLAPINRSRAPTMEESEMILIAQYMRENADMPQEELVSRVLAHRQVIQQEVVNQDLIRKHDFLSWIFYRYL